jgi:multidrug efflux pump subunit AcrB
VDLGEVIIETIYPGASPEDVELNVTNKLEDELKNVTGIERITSTSMENLSLIDIMIDPDEKDIQKVKDDINDAVGRVTDFPAEVTESPLITEITTEIFPIIEVGITGDLPYSEMREIAKQFEKKLKNVPGVSRLEKYGYHAREIKIEVNPKALENYQVSLPEIIQAIQARNIRLTGGTFESYTSERNVVTLAQFREPEEVGDVIVRTTFEGPQIKVKDLAIVKDDFEDATILSHMEGKSAISFVVNKSANADIIRLVKAIKKLVRKESAKYVFVPEEDEPEGKLQLADAIKGLFKREKEEEKAYWYKYGNVRIVYANDESIYVMNSFQIVLKNLAIGLVLVVAMLALFLNIRTAFWVALGIPVSILGVFFLMPFFDTFLDSISLTALILVIGIIVDDGIIISENISRRREMGDTPLEAAINGTQEVFFPVLTTVLTTFLAFAPMFFMKGMLGKFIYVIPLTVSLALFISLFESVFALPSHLRRGMERTSKGAERTTVRQWFKSLRLFYKKFCHFFLKLRYPLVVLFIGILFITLMYAKNNMDFILFPSRGAERFYIGVELPTGTSLQATEEKVKEIETIVRKLPEGELETFITRVGTMGWVGQGENYAYIFVSLTPFSERVRTADEIIEEIRNKTNKLDGFDSIIYEIDAGGPPVGKPITLRVIGQSDEMRKKLANRIEESLQNTTGVKDIDRNDKMGKKQLEIKINYSRLARLGLTVDDVAQNVRIAFDGQVITSIRDGDEDVDFRLQLSERARRDVSYLRNLAIPNKQGRLIKLREVARLETGPGPNAYHHFDGERTTTIQADVDQEVITPIEVTQAVQKQFDIERDWPGMQLQVGGEAEESQKAIINIATIFTVAFIGIYFLLVLLFNSFTQPFLVMIAIPFGIVGVIIALILHKEVLSFLALTGAIGLAGVVVNDSLVLVSHLNELRNQKPDEPIVSIVAEGTSNRLRAIILTTLTTAAGLLPLAYGLGGTSLYMSPMALTLGWGLLFATPLTLVLIPCLYTIGNDLGRIFKRKK